MERIAAMALAFLNACIIVAVLVEGFDAPFIPVMVGCVWAMVGVYLLCNSLERRGAPK